MSANTLCVTTLHSRFLDLLNGLRQRRGLPPLVIDAKLQAAATFRAEDMVARNYFSHETPGRGSARQVIEEFGYNGDLTGENICWGEKTAEEAFDTWVTSQDHLENMVSPHYTAIGIGGPVGVQFQDEKWGLWVTNFGSTLTSGSDTCGADVGLDTERPDKPPRRLRLPRERPPREERHRDKDERDKDERDRDDGRERDDKGPGRRKRDRRERPDERPAAADTTPAGPGVEPGPSPVPPSPGGPSGSIRTAAPWGAFGVGWDQINRWDQAIDRASAEFGVPAERIKAHIVIESGGQPDALQKNDKNGWSFGLMQVVPRWWKELILRLAGRPDTGQDERAVGQLLLDDPVLAVRAGAGVLKSVFDGDWDRTSSKFFLGNPNWIGVDNVNGNTGLQYKAMIDGLIAEIQAARELSTIMSRSAVTPAPTSEAPAAAVQFGRVPHPQIQDRLIEDQFNRAWDDLGPRRVRGVVLHRQQGANWGTDAFFRSMPPGGAGACPPDTSHPQYYTWGGCIALTDYGVDHQSGETLRWNDPTGAAHPGVSPNRSAWASGPYSDAFGDGLAFVQDHGGDENVVNRDQASIEISGTFREPVLGYGADQPISDACKNAVAALIAHFADQFQIPYDRFPFVPGKDYSFVRWHHEFTRGTGKFCPGKDVMDATDDIIARTKAILKAHQTGAEAAPELELELIVTTPGAAKEEAGRGEERAARTATSGVAVPVGAVAGDGSADCPKGYPVKGNASSGIYHVPGGGSYGRTIPEFCFGNAEDAAAAGFRAAKR